MESRLKIDNIDPTSGEEYDDTDLDENVVEEALELSREEPDHWRALPDEVSTFKRKSFYTFPYT